MCDERSEARAARRLAVTSPGARLDRRRFAQLGTAGMLAAAFPGVAACAQDGALTERRVEVPMDGGTSGSLFVAPSAGAHPGVLMWPDIRGLRPAFEAMAKRLAADGYAVLVVNPFWRDADAPVVAPGEQFGDPEVRERIIPMYRKIAEEDAAMADARAYVAFLDAQSETDTDRPVGAAGYCMGGPLVMRTAGAVPDRVGAIASFHGGGLLTDEADSPHRLIPQTSAAALHAVAEDDHEQSPETVPDLRAAYEAAGVPAEIEVYEGTAHGWRPIDSPVYDEEQAENAWARMLALFEERLA